MHVPISLGKARRYKGSSDTGSDCFFIIFYIMERLEIEKDFKGSIDSLLREFADILKLGYAVPNYVYKHSILFIGLNPSLGSEKSGSIELFYDLYDRERSNHYFDKFFEIGEYCNHVWSHLDMFLIRETRQNNVKFWCKDERFRESMIRQVGLTREIISRVEPTVIVVCNTMAREWFRNKLVNPLAYDMVFDDLLGTYRIINDEVLNNVPVFFSGMLSGQRALDLGSLERLKWHIKRAVER